MVVFCWIISKKPPTRKKGLFMKFLKRRKCCWNFPKNSMNNMKGGKWKCNFCSIEMPTLNVTSTLSTWWKTWNKILPVISIASFFQSLFTNHLRWLISVRMKSIGSIKIWMKNNTVPYESYLPVGHASVTLHHY